MTSALAHIRTRLDSKRLDSERRLLAIRIRDLDALIAREALGYRAEQGMELIGDEWEPYWRGSYLPRLARLVHARNLLAKRLAP